jgi:hypothetical protein
LTFKPVLLVKQVRKDIRKERRREREKERKREDKRKRVYIRNIERK